MPLLAQDRQGGAGHAPSPRELPVISQTFDMMSSTFRRRHAAGSPVNIVRPRRPRQSDRASVSSDHATAQNKLVCVPASFSNEVPRNGRITSHTGASCFET